MPALEELISAYRKLARHTRKIERIRGADSLMVVELKKTLMEARAQIKIRWNVELELIK